ncbi:DUF4286 family protein [Empedobacter brevis]|uniref:DUF4286 domain-containing protein n=2 Tax=Empedobacter brevis TaxID=247 RepID=A0A511NDI8_9FLAO|nr:DUF4286 family protein [Empedobacter brevis]MDM1071389.1 DUF4286 family protein [Empedobacter brevis]QES93695.1 DUF4286 family protein [Empedobacter brevis]QHC85542.1 hypothetical protein AS589_12490 [Empedobacter brevis]GEM50666.1 hypothetical protein EB1_04560 [Empedobacter brevis NBRC 14943 = ATCC 43319]
MILYNTTFVVEEKIHDEWFEWLKEEHINDYLKSNCFIGARLGKITSHIEPGAVSYSLQFFSNNELTLDQFKNNFLAEIQQKSLQKYGTQVLAFTSEMDHIGDFS